MSCLGRIAVTPVKISGGCRILRHDAVTPGISVIEFLSRERMNPRGDGAEVGGNGSVLIPFGLQLRRNGPVIC